MAYKRYRGKRPVIGDSRTNPLPKTKRNISSEQVEDFLYRCWFCGFICNENRDVLGDAESINQITYGDAQTPQHPDDGTLEGLSSVTVLGGALNSFVSMEYAADGSSLKGIVHDNYRTATTGCPFCGTLNWKGQY